MSVSYIPAALRRLIEERASRRCEYCLLPENVSFYTHEIDHVIPEKHGGKTDAANLALTCWRCNRHKGTDLGSFDPQTEQFSFLFNPRTQQWSEHFACDERAKEKPVDDCAKLFKSGSDLYFNTFTS